MARLSLIFVFALAAAGAVNALESKAGGAGAADAAPAGSSQRVNQALWLDGNDDYLKTDKWLSGSPGGFCFEAWVKPAGMNPYYQNVSLLAHRAAGNDKFLRYMWAKHSFVFVSALPNKKTLAVAGERKANKNGWYHVALVLDGNTATLYVDGGQAGSTSTTVAPDWDTGYAASFLGGDPFPGTPIPGGLRGLLDEVRIWNKPRSAEEIRSTMSKPPAPDSPGLAAYWNFDEGSGQTARDVTGHGHDAQLGSTPGEDANDPIWVRSDCPAALSAAATDAGHVLWFNGAGAYVQTVPVRGLSSTAKAATIEAWLRPASPPKPACLIALEADPQKRDFRLALVDGGALEVVLNTARGVRAFRAPAGVDGKAWRHVAVVCEAGSVAVVVDGKEALKQALDSPPVWSGQPLLVGAAAGGAEPFFGEIDEVRAWNTARSADRIAADMRRTLAGSEPGLVGCWRFDEGRGEAALDRSPAGAHGRLGEAVWPDGNDPVWLVADRSRATPSSDERPVVARGEGGALQFDGRDDYVEIGNTPELRLEGPITAEAWIKTDLSTFDRPILTKQNVSGKQNSFELLVRNGKPIFRVSDGKSECCGDQGWWPAEGKTDIGVDEWHHIAGVYDRKKVEVYLDGVLEASVPFENPLFDIPFPVRIGTNALVQSKTRKRSFQGLIDEVRLWKVARKQEEILASMNVGLRGDEEGLIGYWTFDEAGATSGPAAFQPVVVDGSSYQNHGFLGGRFEATPEAPQRVVSDAPVVPAPAM